MKKLYIIFFALYIGIQGAEDKKELYTYTKTRQLDSVIIEKEIKHIDDEPNLLIEATTQFKKDGIDNFIEFSLKEKKGKYTNPLLQIILNLKDQPADHQAQNISHEEHIHIGNHRIQTIEKLIQQLNLGAENFPPPTDWFKMVKNFYIIHTKKAALLTLWHFFNDNAIIPFNTQTCVHNEVFYNYITTYNQQLTKLGWDDAYTLEEQQIPYYALFLKNNLSLEEIDTLLTPLFETQEKFIWNDAHTTTIKNYMHNPTQNWITQ